jgi:hypothetical protein
MDPTGYGRLIRGNKLRQSWHGTTAPFDVVSAASNLTQVNPFAAKRGNE